MKPINAEAAALTKAKIIQTTVPSARFPSPAVKSSNRRSPETIFSWRAAIRTIFLEEKWTGNRSQPSIFGTKKKTSEKMPGMFQKSRTAALWPGQRKNGMVSWICTSQRTEIFLRIKTVACCLGDMKI